LQIAYQVIRIVQIGVIVDLQMKLLTSITCFVFLQEIPIAIVGKLEQFSSENVPILTRILFLFGILNFPIYDQREMSLSTGLKMINLADRAKFCMVVISIKKGKRQIIEQRISKKISEYERRNIP
jgi:hypothetical protein